MNPQLVPQLVAFLTPFLPYLLKAGEKAAEEAGKKFGDAAWEKAKSLWDKLRGKPNVTQVAKTAASLPDNQSLWVALQEEIARALEQDKSLAQEVARLMKDEVVQRVIATSSSQIEDVEQRASDGPTRQEVLAEEHSRIIGVKQIRQ